MNKPLFDEEYEKSILHYLFKKFPIVNQLNIKEKILTEIDINKESIYKKLNFDNPFFDNRKALIKAKKELNKGDTSIHDIEKDLKSFQSLMDIEKINIDNNFWNKEVGKLKISTRNIDTEQNIEEDKKICRTLLHDQWQKTLDKLYVKWELNTINQCRKEFLSKLETWLDLVQDMDDFLSDLSISPGVLFDLSKDNISFSAVEALKRWTDYISKMMV